MSSTAVYLNFGAGNPVAGWINLDSSPFFYFPRVFHRVLIFLGISKRSAVYLHNHYQYYKYFAGKKLPFSNGSVSAVYVSHVLEHLSTSEISTLLLEFRRILKKGGIVRILLPDLELQYNRGMRDTKAYFSLEDNLLTLPSELKQNKLRAILEAYHGFPSFHKTIFFKHNIARHFRDDWSVRTELSFLESGIDLSKLKLVEQETRTTNALIFELKKP